MENQNEKIANLHLYISEDCSEADKKIIQLYWKLQDLQFINTPQWIKKEFDITQSQLAKIIATHSTYTLFVLCKNCNSYEKHQVKSQSSFNNVKNLNKLRYSKRFKCDYCEGQEREQHLLEKQKKHTENIQKYKNAIENKNWNNLSIFEKKLLGKCIEMNFEQLKKHYFKLGQSQFIVFIKALENIESQHLLFLERNSLNNYIIEYKYLNELLQYKNEITFIEEKQQSSVEFDKVTNELKFKLTINENQHHPDSPLYAGTVIFKERIIIEPGVEYIFGQWQRAKDNLYLTMIPIENLEKLPVQKRISKLPISIKQGVADFLNNLGKNHSNPSKT